MAPMRASLSSIQSVMQKHTPWIMRRLAEFEKAAANTPPPLTFEDGDSMTYLGRNYKLTVTQNMKKPQGCRLLPHRMLVNLHTAGAGEENLRKETRLEILLWLKKRAKAKMQKRTDLWAKRLGVKYQRLVVANAERRWGSCSPENIIRVNWRLIMAPLAILDYVIVHELCHVRNKNHGPRFWAQVASAMPDWKSKRKHLHAIGGGLTL